jgi:hypothetical protein
MYSKNDLLELPGDVFRMDETGVKTSDEKPTKAVSTRGMKQVGVIGFAEKGRLTTVICCCSSSVRFIAPCFIFGKRKEINDRKLNDGLVGSKA